MKTLFFVLLVTLTGCTTQRVCTSGEFSAPLPDGAPLGERCVFVNSLNYISAIGTVARP